MVAKMAVAGKWVAGLTSLISSVLSSRALTATSSRSACSCSLDVAFMSAVA